MPEFVIRDAKVMENAMQEITKSLGMEVIIRKPIRSKKSNRFYWNILEIISKDLGENKEDLSDVIKLRVLGPKYITYNGEQIAIPKRSSDLEQADFGKLIEAAQMLAASMNILLPLPDHYGL